MTNDPKKQPYGSSKKCKTCVYGLRDGLRTGCYYICHTGEPRGCPAGNDCTRYKRNHELYKANITSK